MIPASYPLIFLPFVTWLKRKGCPLVPGIAWNVINFLTVTNRTTPICALFAPGWDVGSVGGTRGLNLRLGQKGTN